MTNIIKRGGWWQTGDNLNNKKSMTRSGADFKLKPSLNNGLMNEKSHYVWYKVMLEYLFIKELLETTLYKTD